MENKVDVVIGGEVITLKSSNDPAYVQKVARYADKKISELRAKSVAAAIDDRLRTIMVALNIGDDYFKTLDRYTRLDKVHKKLSDEMRGLQKENVNFAARIAELEAEKQRIREENTLLNQRNKELQDELAAAPPQQPALDNILTLPNRKVA
jgi:cell division protein ZapA